MKRTFAYLMTAFVAAALTVTSCSPIKDAPDQKDTVEFEATVNGAQEVPSTPSTATGTMTGTYNKKMKELSYTINYTGITPSAGHIHLAPGGPGTNGGFFHTLNPLTSPISGKVVLTQLQENALMEGRLYVNLHTERYSAGEIRGNIMRKKF